MGVATIIWSYKEGKREDEEEKEARLADLAEGVCTSVYTSSQHRIVSQPTQSCRPTPRIPCVRLLVPWLLRTVPLNLRTQSAPGLQPRPTDLHQKWRMRTTSRFHAQR